jgi:hypothetical protein
MLLLILEMVLEFTSGDCTSDCANQPMARGLSSIATGQPAPDGTHQPTLAFLSTTGSTGRIIIRIPIRCI